MMDAVGGEGDLPGASGEVGDDWEGEEDDEDEEEGEGGWRNNGMGMGGGEGDDYGGDDGPTLSDLMQAMDLELAGGKGVAGDFTRSEGGAVGESSGSGGGETGGGQGEGSEDDDDDDGDDDHDRSSQPVDVDLNLVSVSLEVETLNLSLARSTTRMLERSARPQTFSIIPYACNQVENTLER